MKTNRLDPICTTNSQVSFTRTDWDGKWFTVAECIDCGLKWPYYFKADRAVNPERLWYA